MKHRLDWWAWFWTGGPGSGLEVTSESNTKTAAERS